MKYLENFDHWSDSEELKKINNKIGVLDGDQIKLSISNVHNIPESKHIVTIEDNEILNNYFKEEDGDDYFRFDIVGKTLEEGAIELGSDFDSEWLQHMIIALFPYKYIPAP